MQGSYTVCHSTKSFKSFPATGDFCHLLITFAYSLDADQV